MTHVATPTGTTGSGTDADRALDAALDAAQARVARLTGSQSVVGTVADGRPDRVRPGPLVGDSVVRELCRWVAESPDGATKGESESRPAEWSGYRYGSGGARAAFVVVAATDLDDLTAARLEAVALDLARAALLDEGARRGDQLNQLQVTARRVAESLDSDTVLTSIVEDATTLIGGDSGDMLLWDRDRDKLRVVAVSNFPPDMLGFELAFGEGLSSQAIVEQRTVEVEEYRSYERRVKALDRYDFGAVLCAPLVFRGDAIGALNIHARAGRRGFPAGSADLLAAFAGHAAIAIDHARRYENEVRLGRVLVETNRELTRLLTVQQQLAEQVLLDAGPGGIAGVLAGCLGRPVVIQDHLHRLIAGASPDGTDDWRQLVAGSDPAEAAGRSARDPFTIAVRVGVDVVGHLLISSNDDLGPIDRALVEVATTGVALEFAKERAATEVEERLRGEAATDLLSGSYLTEDGISARAARLGYDLSEPRHLMVIDVRPKDRDDEGSVADHDRARRVLHHVRERLAVRAPRSLAVQSAGRIVVLTGAGQPGRPDDRELAEDLRASLESIAGVGAVTIAVSDRCTRPNDYAPALHVARESIELMLKLGRRGGVFAARELGPYGLLLRASSRDELVAFAQRTLGPLVEHDEAHGGDLLQTLRVYLEEDRVQRRVAARCFIHVNTVVYRVRRIEEMLKLDLGDPATVFDVTLALRIHDLPGDRSPGAAEAARA